MSAHAWRRDDGMLLQSTARRRPQLAQAMVLPMCCAFVLAIGALHAQEDDAPPADPARAEATREKKKLEIPKAEHPYQLPGGVARAGWEKLLANDTAAAEKSFREALAAEPKNLEALEGLRACLIADGRYSESQQINIQMMSASTDSALCGAFAQRAMDALSFAETREALSTAFTAAMQTATPENKALLANLLATLHFSADRIDEAKAALKDVGFVDRWLFATGPFGQYDLNDRMDRRFGPERSLKKLAWKDERGQSIPVRRDLPVPFRTLSLGRLFPGGSGVYYAFTNLFSETDQEVVLMAGAPSSARFFLRGAPILDFPTDVKFVRNPMLIKTRLLKGDNPLLVKMPYAGDLAVRVLNGAYAPAPGVAVKDLAPEVMSAQRVSTVRGFLFSLPVNGSLAEHFLKDFKADERALGKGLFSTANDGSLNVAQARWLELAAKAENDQDTREAIARTLLGSFPDSVATLDATAYILENVGRSEGHTEARHIEEARQMRERGLELEPASHQHLLGLYFFFNARDLKDLAYEHIKKCVQAHDQSAVAHDRLGSAYEERDLFAQAQAEYEKAAALEPAFLDRLHAFHERRGDLSRAAELYEKMLERGMVSRMQRYHRYVEQGKLAEAEKILDEQTKAFPDRADELLGNRAQLLLEKGDLDGAAALRKELVEKQPQNRRALIQLVDLTLRMKKDDEAQKLLADYHKKHPNDLDIRRRLRRLEGDDDAQWWTPYDIKVDTVDTSKFTQARYPRANHAWIVDFMVTKVHPDYSRESYIHIAQKVLNQDGINELSEVLVRAPKQDIVFIRTLNPDGSSFEPENAHDFDFAQTASLYKVGPGSVLEYAYLEQQAADKVEPGLNMAFNFNALDAPRAVSRWVVMLPKDAKLDIRKIRPEMVEEKILPGPEGYTVYQWTNKRIEGIKVEPFMPGEGDDEVIPLVYVESPDRPFRATNWLRRREQYFLPREAQATALDLKARIKDQRLLFTTIVEWVRARIQPGKEARTMDDVWALKSGNSTQMTSLAIAMCRAAGLSVHSAYVNASYQPGTTLPGKNAQRTWEPAQFAAYGGSGRMMVLHPKSGADHWLQFTGQPARYFDPGDWIDPQPGALSLVITEEGVRIKRVLGEKMGTTTVKHVARVSLDHEGNAAVKGRLQLFNLLAGTLRRVLSNPEQEKQVREGVVRRMWPQIELAEAKAEGQSNVHEPLRLNYFGSVPNLANSAEKAWFLKPFLSQPNILGYVGPPERTHDLLVRREAEELDLVMRYESPPGHCWTEVPDDLFLVTEFGFYLADYNVKGNTLTCTRAFLVPVQRVTPDKYTAFMNFLNKISDQEQQQIAYAKRDFPGLDAYARIVLSQGYASHGPDKVVNEDAEVGEAADDAEVENENGMQEQEAAEQPAPADGPPTK